MIDPLETVITYLLAQETLRALVDRRIAVKHEFGGAWVAAQRALTVHLDGGTPDTHVPHQRVQVQMRCYGGSPVQCMELYRALVELSRATEREPVVTTQGQALLYWLVPLGGPGLSYDVEVGSDVLLILCEADVSEGTA